MLDPIQQRIVGVLIEKERTVPDAYPLTENALLAGCNQKSNRDPELDLDHSEIHPALLTLREDGWIARVEGNRAARFRHRIEERLNVSAEQQAVLCELLIRGPQAPGALKPRVARLGLHTDAAGVLGVLEELAAHQPVALVEQLPRRPRERDQRWGHLLGPAAESWLAAARDATAGGGETIAPPVVVPTAPPEGVAEPSAADRDDLERRVARLEGEVGELRRLLEDLTGS